LEMAGIISRHKHPDSKLKILYRLTPKGIDLIPVLVEIIAWSEKYHEVHPYAKEFVKQLRRALFQPNISFNIACNSLLCFIVTSFFIQKVVYEIFLAVRSFLYFYFCPLQRDKPMAGSYLIKT